MSYDPVEPSALQPDQLQHNVDDALAAIAKAADLDELKAARAAAGKRVGEARGAVRAALDARQAELEAERDARVLVDEAVDVTLPWDRRLEGARHPITTTAELISDVFTAMGYEIAEGPEIE